MTANQMQMADQYTIEVDHIPTSELMERAGQAVADAVIRYAQDGGRVVVLIGSGNNGGDGFVAARLLRNKRIPVTAIPLVPIENLKGDTAKQLALAKQAGVKIRPAISHDDIVHLENWLKRAVIVVDAIFGTGLTRPLAGWLIESVKAVNNSDRSVLAVDIPSGINTDNGKELGYAIKADFTLPIAAYKWGHWLNQGRDYVGKLLPPASIGIAGDTLDTMMDKHPSAVASSYLINREMIKNVFPKRSEYAYKNEFGHLWIFGSSQGYTGATRLAAAGAQAVGTGLVSIACPDDVYPIVAASALEVMVHPQESAPWQAANAVVAGPGWGKEHSGILTELLLSDVPLVLDADALNMLSEDSKLSKTLTCRDALAVMTPHPGEAGRLLGISAAEVQEDRLAAALALVDKYKTWVVMKGAHTLTISPDRHVCLCSFGSSNLAVAGTGDVLAGMIGGLLAAGSSPEVAIPAAVGLHAVVGEKSGWHRAGQLETIIAEQVRQFRG
ncbi:MAG: NAD(P)H-hydrate dehydratase [Mariprofundaceae bacterium]